MNLTASQLLSAQWTADQLGIDPHWLLAVVQNESGGDPQAKNPSSSARGIIQFMDSTARSLGYAGSLDLVQSHPTFESQMQGPVLAYFRQYAPFSSKEEFIGSVFYPANRHALDREFPDSVQAANRYQFRTLREYVSRVWLRYKAVEMVSGALPFLSIAAGVGIWYWWRHRGAT